MNALMDETIGKCLTCDNDRTGAHPQCDECRNKMTNETIKAQFNGRYTMPLGEFLEITKFQELLSRDMSGRDDCREIHIGIVDGRHFWFIDDVDVWNNEFGFLDELQPHPVDN